jgi:phospholipid/cholesterol/gamma-HCH transport system substrate-binding protein
MASTHRTRWIDLKLGAIAGIAVVATAVLILIFGRVGTLHGKKFTLYVTTGAARGVIRGTQVWLDGQWVGTVKSVDFQPPAVAASDRLILTLSMLESARPHIRMDTRVQVRAGGSIISDQVVYMSSGTARMRAVGDRDTIRARDQPDFEAVSSDAALASQQFPAIIENVKLLGAQLRSAEGTIGALGLDAGRPEMRRVRARAGGIMSRLSSGRGTIPMALSNGDLLRARAARAMAQADSIRALVSSNRHTLGRFRRDSMLVQSVSAVRNELQRLATQAASPDGTIGRIRTDSALTAGVHRDLASLDSLIADIKKHPLRYIAF